MIFHAFLIKYAEIAIKGKNRYLFEDALVKQMKLALEPVEGEFTVTKEQGRVYVFCPEKYDFDEAVEALQRVFGIVGISPVVIYEDQGFDQMAEDVVAYMKARYPEYPGTPMMFPSLSVIIFFLLIVCIFFAAKIICHIFIYLICKKSFILVVFLQKK